MQNKCVKIFLLMLMTLISASSIALRCGNYLIDEGDNKYEVIKRCGQPIFKDRVGQIDHEVNGYRIKIMNLEEWIYDISGRDYQFDFEGSKVVNIEPLKKK